MMDVYERLIAAPADDIHDAVVLDHLQRERGRFRVNSARGEEVRVFLKRGQTLRIGEVLRTTCGKYLVVEGAEEDVLYAEATDWQTFSRACYHLGNRHTRVEIGERGMRIVNDHVLQAMLEDLGLTTRVERAVFVPEPGAYAKGHGHHH
jgi:urease accessory protein